MKNTKISLFVLCSLVTAQGLACNPLTTCSPQSYWATIVTPQIDNYVGASGQANTNWTPAVYAQVDNYVGVNGPANTNWTPAVYAQIDNYVGVNGPANTNWTPAVYAQIDDYVGVHGSANPYFCPAVQACFPQPLKGNTLTSPIGFPQKNHPGDFFEGGKIVWVDQTGLHGLVAALADNGGLSWGSNSQTGATADGSFAGQRNTTLALFSQVSSGDHGNHAGLACANYAVQANGMTPCASPGAPGQVCYADWYLPSKYELNQLFLKKSVLGHFSEKGYWSSTEVLGNAASHAWAQQFETGAQISTEKETSNQVRCVRRF